MHDVKTENRDHVFISYAWEDLAFVEWLAYKLTSLGYNVWCDRIKIFGGESFPRDSDKAIKNRTYRLLAVMSEYSIEKPNPTKERTIAHGIAKERKIDFIIPLNRGLKPTELDWMSSDLAYVDFSYNWAEGLAQLLKALDKAQTPCAFDEAKEFLGNSLISDEIINDEPETIYSNFLRIKKIPDAITVISFKDKLSSQQNDQIRRKWACRGLNPRTFLSFHKPPEGYPYAIQNAHLWRGKDSIEGIETEDLISELLLKSLHIICHEKGLLWTSNRRWLYFPHASDSTNRISFIDTKGRKNNIQVAGERTYFRPGNSTKYRYYLAPTFKILRNMCGQDFIVRMGLRVRITTTSGHQLEARSSQSRRKHVTKDWWNYEWVNRYLAVCNFLSGGNDEMVLGNQDQYKLAFDGKPMSYTSPFSLNETRIDERVRARKSILNNNDTD